LRNGARALLEQAFEAEMQETMHRRSDREVNRLPVMALILRVGTALHDIGDVITDIYFPINGIASLQVLMKDDYAIDTAIVGRDGALGADNYNELLSVGCAMRSAVCPIRVQNSRRSISGADAKAAWKRATYFRLRWQWPILKWRAGKRNGPARGSK
jgi:hypothetical protein